MLSKNLSFSTRDLICGLASTYTQKLFMIVRIELRHEHFYIFSDNILFLDVAKDLTETHVTLIDDSQAF